MPDTPPEAAVLFQGDNRGCCPGPQGKRTRDRCRFPGAHHRDGRRARGLKGPLAHWRRDVLHHRAPVRAAVRGRLRERPGAVGLRDQTQSVLPAQLHEERQLPRLALRPPGGARQGGRRRDYADPLGQPVRSDFLKYFLHQGRETRDPKRRPGFPARDHTRGRPRGRPSPRHRVQPSHRRLR